MSGLLVETSVLVKWFDTRGEEEVTAAHALRDAHGDGNVVIHLLDLALYELGNVLLRRRKWPGDDVADQLAELADMLGPVVPISVAWTGDAARIGEEHRLSFYDACWAAAARQLQLPLISADGQLLQAGLAEPATAAATRLGLLR